MRIAMVTDGADADQDSTDLAATLSQLGHDVVVHDSCYGRRGPELTQRFAELWWTTRPEVVHCRSRVAGKAAMTAAKAAAIPVVHNARPTETATIGTVERDLALRADRVLASCTAELAELVAGSVPKHQISVVPHGVDTEHFTPDGDHRPNGSQHRLVAIGDLTPGAGFATAVAALCGLPDTELVIAGAPHHGNHAKELREYARRLGVSHRLRIRGPVDRASRPSLLRSAHVVVCTPWRPRFGVAALEAAACGVAVVANNTGGLTDIVLEDATGMLVTPHQPRALAAAVWKLISLPGLREQYGATARARACVRYSWHRIAADTLDTYRLAGATGQEAPRATAL